MSFVSDAVGSVLGTGGTTQADMISQDPALLRSRIDYGNTQGVNLQEALQQQALQGGGPLNTIFQNQLGKANNQAASLIASQRTVNPGMAARLAATASGQANQQALGQAAQNQLASQQLASQNNLGFLNAAQGNISQQNSSNAGIAAGNNKATSQGIGGLLGGAGALAAGALSGGAAPAAAGGLAGSSSGDYTSLYSQRYADGGAVQSKHQAYFCGGPAMAQGGAVPAMVSPGEVYIPPAKLNAAQASSNPMAKGEKIPGKPKVKGNSLKNDVVPKTLEEGGVVIPNSIMQSDDPAGKAHAFISQIMAKQNLKARRKK